MTADRQLVDRLIDCLSEAQLASLARFLEAFVDPVAMALLKAPLDDEPESDEERLAAEEAREWFRQNRESAISNDEMMRRFGVE